MSFPSELPYSPGDFFAKWMPSSTRAGVILGLSPERAGPLPNITAAAHAPLLPDDSFASDFSPLPASTDSSDIDVGGGREGGRQARNLHPAPQGGSDGQFQSVEEMAGKSQDLPVMMKLEELRKWQQHMHEQLKAHQLEELLCLQEEQQRLLGIVNGSQICMGERSGLPGAQWHKDMVQPSPDRKYTEMTRGVCGLQQELQVLPASREEQLSEHQPYEDDDTDSEGEINIFKGTWDSGQENPKWKVDPRHFSQLDDELMQSESNSRQQRRALHDRPIKPGIGGQKKTFEELLEEQLRLEEQRLKSAQQQPKPTRPDAGAPPKRPFLKRGQGLSRFTSGSKASTQKEMDRKDQKPQPEARAFTRSNSAPGSILKGSSNGVPQHPVQRKTAILNKENRVRGLCLTPQDVRVESKASRTRVLGSHQRQNMEAASIHPEPDARQVKHLLGQQKEHNLGVSVPAVRNADPILHPNPVTKQVGLLGGPGRPGSDTGKVKSCVAKVESAEVKAGGEEGGGPPQDSFELSFQEKLQRWESNRQLESMELGEFELLEQAAEELSFSSNSSFVMKVLHMDQRKRQAAIGLHKRRLSSTPIKSTPGSERQESRTDGSKCEGVSPEPGASAGSVRGDVLKNKVNDKNEGGEESEAGNKEESGSDFGDKEVPNEGAVCFSAPSDPTYDKRTYQDEDSLRDSASDGVEGDEESDAVCSSPDGSTLIEDRDGQQRKVIFDDDDTWNDLDDTAVSKEGNDEEVSPAVTLRSSGVSPSEKTMLRKVAASRAVELDKGLEVEPPPASQLMTRLFPSLKPKAQSAPLPGPSAASENNKPQDDTAQQVQSRQLRERLAELEIEIERFKKENAALAKLRQENEKRQEDLRKERLAFEKTKTEELAKFEEYKKEENKKLQKERKLFEKHAAASRNIPDRKEREEIQLLKQQLSSLQEELKRREGRWSSTHSRLRQQIDSLNQENSSLQDEIRMLEKLRLSGWKKSPASAEKGVQTKHGPRTSDSGVPSVTKGVTFATPLDSTGSSSSPPLSSTAARRNSKDSSQGAAGMRSSLRRSVGSGSSLPSSSSTFSCRRMEEKPRPAIKIQENASNQKSDQSQDCSPKTDQVPEKPESCDATEADLPSEVITHPDGKVEKVLANGDRLIVFPNGTRKEVSADGLSAKVTFFNGDTKQITADQRVIYFYAEAQTTHITYPDGMEVLHFPNNQTEKHFPDGRKEITFPDQTVKNLFPDGREESVLTDGTIIQVNPDGTKEIHFNTGQREIHTADYKRREYPDGTVKTVYTDGRQETRYPTGRLRVKDKDGNVIMDNRV